MIEQSKAVHIVAGHLNRHEVPARAQQAGDVQLVDSIITVRTTGRTASQKLAIDRRAINRRGGDFQGGLPLSRRPVWPIEASAKPDGQIHLRLAAGEPNGFGRQKPWFLVSPSQRAQQHDCQQAR